MLRDGSARSRNSLVIVQADKILPPHPAERSASNVSITQFDTFRNGERPQPTPVAPARPQHTASSSAAQKVMNWFRRKSVVKGPFVPPVPISREPSRLSTAQVNPNAKAPPVPSPPPHSLTVAPSVPRENKENALPTTPVAPHSQDQIPGKSVDTTIHSPQPRRSGVSDQALLNKLPRPATVGRDLVKQTEPIAPPAPVNPITSSPFNEARLRVHVGVVDQSALTSKSAVDVMEQVQKVLYGMGIEVKRETEFKLRCMRVRRKKAGAMTGLGLSSFGNSSIASMAALTTASSGNVSGDIASSS
jgi:protein-serine/threonine kinase